MYNVYRLEINNYIIYIIIYCRPLLRPCVACHRIDCGPCVAQGELTITAEMEELGNALFLDRVPDTWTRRAYPSLQALSPWFADLLQRIKELETWTTDFQLPASVWLAGFFNPQSFLTAIMQQMARKVTACSRSPALSAGS